MEFNRKNTPYKARNKYFNYINDIDTSSITTSSTIINEDISKDYVYIDWNDIDHEIINDYLTVGGIATLAYAYIPNTLRVDGKSTLNTLQVDNNIYAYGTVSIGTANIENNLTVGGTSYLPNAYISYMGENTIFRKGLTAYDYGDNPSIEAYTFHANGNITGEDGFFVHGNGIIDEGIFCKNAFIGQYASASTLDIAETSNLKGNTIIGKDDSEYELKTYNADLNYEIADITGHGAGINQDGQACFDSLTLRKFLSVPELRYNRVTVMSGIAWLAPAAGKIKQIISLAASIGKFRLDLEEGEAGTFAVNDICMGIWHFESGNSSSTSDDNKGVITIKGFETIYFKVTAVEDYVETDENNVEILREPNGLVTYALYHRVYSRGHYMWDQYGVFDSCQHPVAGMNIVGYGNSSDTTRQNSIYATQSYIRFLKGVTDFDLTNKIAVEFKNGGEIIAHNAGSIKITNDTSAQRYWDITSGAISHSTSGLSLTSDGKLYDPDGLHLEVGTNSSGIHIHGGNIDVKSDNFNITDMDNKPIFGVGTDGRYFIKGRSVTTITSSNWQNYVMKIRESDGSPWGFWLNFDMIGDICIFDSTFESIIRNWSNHGYFLMPSFEDGSSPYWEGFETEDNEQIPYKYSDLRKLSGRKILFINETTLDFSFQGIVAFYEPIENSVTIHGYNTIVISDGWRPEEFITAIYNGWWMLPSEVTGEMWCKIKDRRSKMDGYYEQSNETIYWRYTLNGDMTPDPDD